MAVGGGSGERSEPVAFARLPAATPSVRIRGVGLYHLRVHSARELSVVDRRAAAKGPDWGRSQRQLDALRQLQFCARWQLLPSEWRPLLPRPLPLRPSLRMAR